MSREFLALKGRVEPETKHVVQQGDIALLRVAWRVEGTGPDGQPVSSLNELHIPVERDILAAMTSEDIIHSFWVPRLAGKIDVVPTHTNELAFNANSEGEYSGQCAEFCGRGHALMRMRIIAESESEFLSWIKEQQAAASPTTTVSPTPGSQ